MSLLEELHKPDILDCISHLSSDEVFTPPKLVNQILDTLPQELFKSPDTKFLDPCCKSGVFLREIAKRLIDGLEEKIPDLEQRTEHIFKNQLFGIAITELTSLLSRRSVYCSKDASGEYSIVNFDNNEGNIEYKRTYHVWFKDKCMFCGASKSEYDRPDILETHAYSFIHTDEFRNKKLFERLKEMKFDVIIGNPPYQLSTGGSKSQAIPLYHLFVNQAKKLNPRYITMIIPSRYFAGGMGLDKFRNEMLSDKRIRTIVDYCNAKDCFPGISLSGGVNYFLWDRDNEGLCKYTNNHDNKNSTLDRKLDEYPIFVRFNEAIDIINKVKSKNEKNLTEIVSSLSPFGIDSKERGSAKPFDNSYSLYSSNGVGYVSKSQISTGKNLINSWKVMVSKVTSEHAGEANKDGQFKVFSTLKVLKPNEVCTFSYFIIGNEKNKETAQHIYKYLKTKFVRFLLLQAVSSINLSKDKFIFVPIQNFAEEWTDEKLYKKYNLSIEEIDFIESLIKAME